MKKFKLVSIFLAICLFVGTLSSHVSATETTNQGSTVTAIQPYSLVTGDENASTFPSYDLVVPVSTKSLVVPIEVNYKGQLKINLLGKVVSGSIEITLYSDSTCTSKMGYSRYLSSTSIEDVMKVDIPAKATYYLRFDLSKYAEADSTVSIVPYSLSSENKTLKNKEWLGSHVLSYDSQISHKVTIESNGYIAVEGTSLSGTNSMYVTLCNSKSQKLSDQKYISSINNCTTYFAVKKGTYYINAKSTDDYKLRYTFTGVKDSSGKSKSKASSIGKGKTLKGLILSEDSINKVDWYKVRLSKKKVLSFNISAKSCDSIKFEVVPASSRIILFGSIFRIYDAGGNTYKTKDSLPAGTYYIKVTKTYKTASGFYSIKFN